MHEPELAEDALGNLPPNWAGGTVSVGMHWWQPTGGRLDVAMGRRTLRAHEALGPNGGSLDPT